MKNKIESTKGKFKKDYETFPTLLAQLENSRIYERNEIPKTIGQGIYVFYEHGIPLYVGRSGRNGGRFKTRIQEHGRDSSGHNTATFAFLIAKEDIEAKGKGLNNSRIDVEQSSEFAAAKKRVFAMQVKFIELIDPVTQTLFEVYAALELETPYNEWGTH